MGLFENDVNMYGTQAARNQELRSQQFENDVNMYGTQASFSFQVLDHGLRMM